MTQQVKKKEREWVSEREGGRQKHKEDMVYWVKFPEKQTKENIVLKTKH